VAGTKTTVASLTATTVIQERGIERTVQAICHLDFGLPYVD
jgi:hypothetical protein